MPALPRDRFGRLLNDQSAPFAIVHQFDRHVVLRDYMERLYPEAYIYGRDLSKAYIYANSVSQKSAHKIIKGFASICLTSLASCSVFGVCAWIAFYGWRGCRSNKPLQL